MAIGKNMSGVLTWALVGAALGSAGGAVYGTLCGTLWALLNGEPSLILSLGVRCLTAGLAAGALVCGFGRLFGGDTSPLPEERDGANFPVHLDRAGGEPRVAAPRSAQRYKLPPGRPTRVAKPPL
jgi:hypothetical protein